MIGNIISETLKGIFMLKRKGTVVLIASTVLFLFIILSEQKHTDINEIIATQNNKPEKSLTIDNSPPLQSKELKNSTTNCRIYDKKVKINNFNRANFISKKSIQWYFEGYDKYKIAETLAATFSYSIASQWIKDINGISLNHEHYAQLIQEIDTLDYSSNFLKKVNYTKKLSIHKLNIYKPDLDSQNLFNQYPDLTLSHLHYLLNNALQNKNTDEALLLIDKLAKEIEDPRFFEHPLKNTMIMYQLSFFSESDASKLIRALFVLSPVYTDNRQLNDKYTPALLGLNIDKKQWKFELLNNESFNADTTINGLIKSLENNYPSLSKFPNLSDACSSEKTATPSTEIKSIKVSKNTKLSLVWGGIKTLQCPKAYFLQNMISINKKLKENSLSLDDLRGFDDILKSRKNLKMSIESFNEYDRAFLYHLLYLNSQLQPEQIDILIKSGITPTNSDFFLLIKMLDFQQQKQLITKYQYKLHDSNFNDSSMIANAIMYGSNEEIVPFLIEQGFPLKQSESSVDPLWLQLERSSARNNVSTTIISSLIDLTEFNETHVNMMHRIKQKNIDIYSRLITEFPELNFPPPDKLTEISCR
jgi:hypothetical protein